MNCSNISRTALVAALAIGLGACSGGLFGGGDGKKVTPTMGERQPILSRIETGAKVDPALADDKNLDEVQTITLAYTFFVWDDAPEAASVGGSR